VDRVDSWLNRQRGWRRGLLGWLHMYGLTIMVGSALWSLFGPGTPGLGLAFLRVTGWSALAAAPLTGLIAFLQGTRTGKRSVFSWRVSAAALFFLSAAELNVLTDQQADWPRSHRAVGLVTLLLMAISFTFVLMAVSRYRRHGTRLADDGQIHLTARPPH
jgi:hypothetical protein